MNFFDLSNKLHYYLLNGKFPNKKNFEIHIGTIFN